MSNYNSSKQVLLSVVGVAILIIVVVGVAFAFFNYTRTGTANTIKTGRIVFNTSQDSTLTLTNVFPVDSSSVSNDFTQDTLSINITGDTTYGDGVEYLVTAEEVNVEVGTGANRKKVPLTLILNVSDDLGTEDKDNDQIDYFTNREDKDTSYYKILSESVLYDGQYLLVGYIAPGENEIDGTLNIKAYLDKDRVAISDTYDGTESEINGTSNEWVNGRTILTTSEWNSLIENNHELSFKVRIEANEGIWVDPATNPNAIGVINGLLKSGTTEIHFIKETPIRMQQRYDASSTKFNLTDTTLNEGKVLGWKEGSVLYIASSGETYLPANSSGFFGGFSTVTKIVFENVNTSRVTNMSGMFSGLGSLTSLNMSSWNTSNVTNMTSMFYNTSSLMSVNMSGWDTSNVTNMASMFAYSGVTTLDLSGFDTSKVENFAGLINLCHNIVSVDIGNMDFSSAYVTAGMFAANPSLTTIYASGVIDTSNISISGNMFNQSTALVGGNGTTYDYNHSDKEYARIDGNGGPGYFTQSTNLTRNVMKDTLNNFANDKTNITKVEFKKMNPTKLEEYYEAATLTKADITLAGDNNGKVLAWLSDDPNNSGKYYLTIASDGITYLSNGWSLFENFSSLTDIKFNNADFSELTTMNSMFKDCTELTRLDLSGLNTPNIQDMSNLLRNDMKLEYVNLSGLGGDNLSTVSNILIGCAKLTELDMSYFNFGNSVVSYQFPQAVILEKINLSYANFTGNDITYLFDGLTTLEEVNFKGTITTGVTDFKAMFRHCTSLTTIDLSDLDTNSVTSYWDMFNGCTNLTTIYVSNSWNVIPAAQHNFNAMFYQCTSLVGGNGTTFDSSITGTQRAVIDTPGTPGYLTLKNN